MIFCFLFYRKPQRLRGRALSVRRAEKSTVDGGTGDSFLPHADTRAVGDHPSRKGSDCRRDGLLQNSPVCADIMAPIVLPEFSG
jgi:hypothetical protein